MNLYIIKISIGWKKIQHKRKLLIFLHASNIVSFSLKKRWKLLSKSVFMALETPPEIQESSVS